MLSYNISLIFLDIFMGYKIQFYWLKLEHFFKFTIGDRMGMTGYKF